MQPMINIALRAIRSSNEQINMILEREELSFTDPEKLKRVIARVDAAFYDNLSRALQRAYPTHQINKKGDLKGAPKSVSWHIMPVHNTASLVRGLSDWCFSLVCKKNDQTEHAIIIFPVTGDEYTASRGGGASLNGKRIRVSGTKELELSVLSTNILEGVGKREEPATLLEAYAELDKSCFGVRSAHCIPQELAYLASGKIDVAILNNINPLETVAGLLIAKEAGALHSDVRGNPLNERSRSLICCNPKMLKPVSQKAHKLAELLK
ncbi:inositol monophosphatase [Hahella sp. KA22]|uniref:inositol monophosphatase family protein n=1 Tax=Hahella sp. KA22 TaxID=1628392 RepID=UPI000FDDDEF3|nr:inositol monophosphatase family protein [Hahella sp. KA22]AZZ93324.1 inositol monophosphatase [Hahella sp. KA22]QAY56698.1 inositol monophosphatase [Hahella sp. KA22]